MKKMMLLALSLCMIAGSTAFAEFHLQQHVANTIGKEKFCLQYIKSVSYQNERMSGININEGNSYNVTTVIQDGNNMAYIREEYYKDTLVDNFYYVRKNGNCYGFKKFFGKLYDGYLPGKQLLKQGKSLESVVAEAVKLGKLRENAITQREGVGEHDPHAQYNQYLFQAKYPFLPLLPELNKIGNAYVNGCQEYVQTGKEILNGNTAFFDEYKTPDIWQSKDGVSRRTKYYYDDKLVSILSKTHGKAYVSISSAYSGSNGMSYISEESIKIKRLTSDYDISVFYIPEGVQIRRVDSNKAAKEVDKMLSAFMKNRGTKVYGNW